MRAYNGTNGGHMSNAVLIGDFCRSWKKPGAKELRRSERQDTRAEIRKVFIDEKTREVLVARIKKNQAEWAAFHRALGEM